MSIEWISPRESAIRLGLSDARIHQLIRLGRLRVQMTPIGRLVDAESVEEQRLLRVAP